MSTSIKRFLIKATGPKNVRSELRLKTRPLSGVLNAINSVGMVRTEIPQSVFGGDIFTLMSGRLKELLLYPEQAEDFGAADSARTSKFMDMPDISSGLEAISINTLANYKMESLLSPFPSLAQSPDPTSPRPVSPKNIPKTSGTDLDKSPNITQTAKNSWMNIKCDNKPPIFGKQESIKNSPLKKKNPSATLRPQKTVATGKEPEMVSQHGGKPSFSGTDDINKRLTQKRPAPASILVDKLRAYWRLTQLEQPLENASNPLRDEEKNEGKRSPSFSLLPAGTLPERSWPEMMERHAAQKIHSLAKGNGMTGYSRDMQQTIQSGSLPQRSWPEMIGRHAAQKIHSSTKGNGMTGYSRDVQQIMQSGLPEKVEIQNIFNIDVKGDGDRGLDSTRDLSEKIADILREQALQHGIDIT